MNIRYLVELSDEEQAELQQLLSGGRRGARQLKRAQVLLAAARGEIDAVIAATLSVGTSTVYRTKRRFVEGRLAAALAEQPRIGAERKLSGAEEALLVAVACSNPPSGRARWTLEPPSGGAEDQAMAAAHVVHPDGRCRICRADGRCPGAVYEQAQPQSSGGVFR